MALVGEAETGFRVWRAKLVREKSLRGAVSLPFAPSSPRMRLDQKLDAGVRLAFLLDFRQLCSG
jgi:hypothetical protein